MKKRVFGFVAMIVMFTALTFGAQAETVWYQPTPYPKDVTSGVHAWNGWFTNWSGNGLVQDGWLQIGSWGMGDIQASVIKFDLDGLPPSVTGASLFLYGFPSSAKEQALVAWYPITSDWEMSTIGWSKFPKIGNGYYNPAPPKSFEWNGYYLTNWYNEWKSGVRPDKGILFWPHGNNGTRQSINFFMSLDSISESARPILGLTFTPPVTVPNFKMPLPRNVSWRVTTEVGGYGCHGGSPNSGHAGTSYFSIDFGWGNKGADGKPVYKNSPDAGENIPIYPAADGVVVSINSTNASLGTGYFVGVSHDPGKDPSKGFLTRYLHLKNPPLVKLGQPVYQGSTILGYMGSTGNSTL